MKLFYCPVCYKEEIRDDDPYKNEKTIVNMRDGYGRPITHYKCECGNYLAGAMNISGWEDDESLIGYAKGIIEGYNKGGCYYDHTSSLNGDSGDLFERAKQVYKQRKEDASKRVDAFLKEIHWYEQCDKNNGDKCKHGRCKYSVLTLGNQENGFSCGRKSV